MNQTYAHLVFLCYGTSPKKAIHVTHCPTEEMVTDFFMKPLQGSLFIKIRKYIMGNEEPAYQALTRSVLSNHNLELTFGSKNISPLGSTIRKRRKER